MTTEQLDAHEGPVTTFPVLVERLCNDAADLPRAPRSIAAEYPSVSEFEVGAETLAKELPVEVTISFDREKRHMVVTTGTETADTPAGSMPDFPFLERVAQRTGIFLHNHPGIHGIIKPSASIADWQVLVLALENGAYSYSFILSEQGITKYGFSPVVAAALIQPHKRKASFVLFDEYSKKLQGLRLHFGRRSIFEDREYRDALLQLEHDFCQDFGGTQEVSIWGSPEAHAMLQEFLDVGTEISKTADMNMKYAA